MAARATILDLDPTLLYSDPDGTVHCDGCWKTQDDMPDVTNIENLSQTCPYDLEDSNKLKTARYYPTVTAMGDGRMLIMGGASESEGCQVTNGEGANTPMIFDYTKPKKPTPQDSTVQWATLTNGRGLPGPGLHTIGTNVPTMEGCTSGCNSLTETFDQCFCENNTSHEKKRPSQYAADWTDYGNQSIPNKFHVHYYPHNILLSDGTVYMGGSLAGPYGPLAGNDPDGNSYNIRHPCTTCNEPWENGPITAKFHTNGTGSWSHHVLDGLPVREGSTVMYAPNKLLKAGGNTGPASTTDMAYTIDLSGSSAEWTPATHMQWQRRGNNLVILPDGKVLAATGAKGSQSNPQNINCPELWNPATGAWSPMASMDPPCLSGQSCTDENLIKGNRNVRADHSEALLLPDGRVLVIGGEYGADADKHGNKSAQIFSPPYLFIPDVTRPIIALMDPENYIEDTLRYGMPKNIVVSSEIDAVSLIKLGATTHGFDQEQRFIPLAFEPVSLPPNPYNFRIHAPANGFEAPPGYYMLFVLNDGVPSVARIVKLEGCVPAGTSPDCNSNGLPDVCDISTGVSIDCDLNGVPDECPGPCPVASISTVTLPSPPHLTRDARQPHPVDNNSLTARQGIGSAYEPISVKLTTCGRVAPACFQLCETGIETVKAGTGTPSLSANQIASVTRDATDPYLFRIVLARPISAGHWTTIKYWSSNQKVSYASLPGDVNGNGTSISTGAQSDVTVLQNCINNPTSCSIYRRDIDHSGASNGSDLIALANLHSGSQTFILWDGVSLPTNNCFTGGGGGPYCPADPCGGGWDPQAMAMSGGMGAEELEGESLVEGEEEPVLSENAQIANGFAELLTESDPISADELAQFHDYVSQLTEWCLNHFSEEEKAPFVQWLADPERVYATQAGQDAAAGVVQVLTP